MARAKLILICQCGGEFVTNDDGSLTYAGGEAHAVNVNRETLFVDLKLKLAEMCNLEYKTLFIKYFLPGNRRTLITLSNDKDFKRMVDFHGNSVTADVFVMGREGFDRDALNIYANRESGIKPAETVKRVVPCATTSPPDAVITATPASCAAIGTSPPPTDATPSATPDSMSSPSSADSDDDFSAVLHTPAAVDAVAHSPLEIDISGTPADTVKKRRRTASWKIGANGPTIVAIADDGGEKRSRKNSRSHSTVALADEMEQKWDVVTSREDFDTPSTVTISDDVSLEKLVASWKDGITGIGQDFKSVYEFRDALQKYAIAHRFVYRLKKNDTNRASGRCVTEGCSWRIHASWVPAAKSFRIKKLNTSHTCGGESWKSVHPTKNWLVSIIKDRLRDSPRHKPKDIANGIFKDFGIELNYTQVWRGIEDAREQLQGSYKDAYDQLPGFCEKMVETNPGSFAKLIVNDEKKFQRLFVSFHASIHGFQNGCRPLVFLEATSLKSKFQEILLTATTLDGDDGFFPVAFAVVDVENNDNWHWFLEQLKSAVSTSISITFVSDREKGLKESVLEVFGNAYHGYSMYHLLDSFKKNLKGPFHGDGKASLPGFFVAAAHAVRLDRFKHYTEQIKRVSSQAHDWVLQIEREYWTKSSFKGESFNHITQNVGESYTKLMDEMRELPIIQKIEALIGMMVKLINTRRMDSSKWSSTLAPSKEEKLQEQISKACELKVLISSDTLFEVRDGSTNVVNLDKWDCSCLGWTAGLPCHHAIGVFKYTGKNVYDYCSRYFTADSFRSTYSKSINPVPGISKPAEKEVEKEADKEGSSSDTVHVLPPCPSRPPSGQLVVKKRATSPGASKKVVSCSRCKETGHNKATCKTYGGLAYEAISSCNPLLRLMED
ncbi:uncharacterized protein LOC132279839 [Cornus florida]|uniref:uncharacterized protein LOC132279839 n=1 Tax=Cornus florida TaxID=4283 RepID=UPI00289BE7D0|nr:uncharacterized protein LOC132279839 [Cornus florida]XP_059637870.1 uncharacterized protein LOC132279839 [Cornus florida]